MSLHGPRVHRADLRTGCREAIDPTAPRDPASRDAGARDRRRARAVRAERIAASRRLSPEPRTPSKPGARPARRPVRARAPTQPPPRRRAEPRTRQAAALKAMRDYRASLDRLLAVYESDLGRATELSRSAGRHSPGARPRARTSRKLEVLRLDRGGECRRDAPAGSRRPTASMIEATLSDYIARLPALRRRRLRVHRAFFRYSGTVPFGLPDAPKVQRFFAERFGRALPVSAWGQSAAHDRFGFDHRHALDVAVHPGQRGGSGARGLPARRRHLVHGVPAGRARRGDRRALPHRGAVAAARAPCAAEPRQQEISARACAPASAPRGSARAGRR